VSEIVNECEELQLAKSGSVAVKPEARPVTESNLPKVFLPADGRNMSDVASQVGRIMGPKKTWFLKGDVAVEVREVQITKEVRTNVFHPLSAAEVITAIEDHLLTGRGSKGEDGEVVFARRSMSREIATALLASPQFKRQLPRIDRILDVPVPSCPPSPPPRLNQPVVGRIASDSIRAVERRLTLPPTTTTNQQSARPS
jgi:hypothetical protein